MIYLLCMLAGCRLLKGRLGAGGCRVCPVPDAAGDGGMEECVRHRRTGGAVGVFTEAAKAAGPVSEHTGPQTHRSSL